MSKRDKILSLISDYITEKNNNLKWSPGIDWVKYSGPFFDDKEIVEAVSTLLNGWLILGDKSREFERKFAPLLGKKFGIVINSGSSANLIMVSAAKEFYKLKEKTNVITPAAGFPTTLNPIIQNNFNPIFVDIELETLNINTNNFDNLPRSDVLMFAHTLGNPANMDVIMDFVNRNKLILLEDCCDALGSFYDGKVIGSHGSMSTCSFFPAHHISMAEGGFLACSDIKQLKISQSFREWGRQCSCVGEKAGLSTNGVCGCRFSNWIKEFPNEIFDHKYVYGRIGYNLKPIELQCAIGLEQIKKLPIIHQKRKENYRRLFDIFDKYEEYFILPKATAKADPSWFAFPLTIRNNSIFKRIKLLQFLESKKIQTRTFFGGNLLLQPAYKDLYKGDAIRDFPNATKAMFDTFFLGVSPVITQEQINYIGEIIAKFFKSL